MGKFGAQGMPPQLMQMLQQRFAQFPIQDTGGPRMGRHPFSAGPPVGGLFPPTSDPRQQFEQQMAPPPPQQMMGLLGQMMKGPQQGFPIQDTGGPIQPRMPLGVQPFPIQDTGGPLRPGVQRPEVGGLLGRRLRY